MRVFKITQDDRFCRLAADHIASEYPEVADGLSDTELLRRVELAFKRAQHFRFTSQASVLGYIVLMFTVSPEFDMYPGIHQILYKKNIPPDARLAYLAEGISSEEWNEARSTADPRFWDRRSAAASS